jgi:hypothetical protein
MAWNMKRIYALFARMVVERAAAAGKAHPHIQCEACGYALATEATTPASRASVSPVSGRQRLPAFSSSYGSRVHRYPPRLVSGQHLRCPFSRGLDRLTPSPADGPRAGDWVTRSIRRRGEPA